jgi:hypothetical protein
LADSHHQTTHSITELGFTSTTTILAIIMFRSALLNTARAATRPVCRRQAAIARPLNLRSPLFQSKNQLWFQAARCYSAAAGLSKDEVQGRILDLLKNFDKVRFLLAMLLCFGC